MRSDVLFIVKVVLFLLVCEGIPTIYCQEVGDSCSIQETGQSGTCKIYTECPGVEDLARKQLPITICGFYQLTTLVVCCKNELDSHSNIPTPNDLGLNNFQFPSDEDETPRKSEQKCKEYTTTITEEVQYIPLVANTEPISISVAKCEYNSVALIVGGTPASIGEFPFMAAIGFPDSEDKPDWRCGGSLISYQWVLTAAHCTLTRNGKPKWVRLGALDMSKDEELGREDYEIDKIIPHPNYKYPSRYHDIALLSTAKTVTFSKLIRPACLYTKSTFSNKAALATGWGQTDYAGPNSDKLLKVQLNIFDNSKCTRAYEKEINTLSQISSGITKSMLCAGELKGGKDTCQGDSGGPLFTTEQENMCKFYIVGITSFGKLCGQENVPAIYTRVSEYLDWIENTIW